MNSKLFRIVAVAVIASILFFALLPQVEAQHGYSGQNSKYYITHAYEEVTSTTGVTDTITAGIINTTDPKTQRAYIAVSGQAIRFTCDGTTPSTSLGMPLADGDWVQIIGLDDIQNFEFINDDDTGTAKCHISLQTQNGEMN